tara:strand:+ start:135 stop:1892 length:1758 start_codon:yes stop_codon:yes gene_type:complete
MTWSSFEKDKLLTESWRKFLQEEGQTIFGLNSKDNKDSLINILNKLAGALTPEQKIAIVNLVANAASDEDIMLEAVSLQGSKSEQDRVFSSETTREILQGIVGLGLDTQKQKAVVKALNYWGRVNTVKFEKPAAASPAAPDEAPNKEPQAAPEANFDAESGAPLTEEAKNALIDKLLSSNTKQEFSDIYNQLSGSEYGNPKNRQAWIERFDEFPNIEDTKLQRLLPKIAQGLSAFGSDDRRVEIRTKFIDLFSSPSEAPQTDETPAEDSDDLEAENAKAKEKADIVNPKEAIQKKEELRQQIEILKTIDEPDKGFLGLLQNNPLNFMFNIPSNIIDGLITVYKLEPEQRTKGNLSKVVIQEIFDMGDSTIAGDLLPDNTPYLLKEKQFKQLFTGVLTNITTKGGKALDAAVRLCTLCKGVLAGKAVISKIPKVGVLIVALAQAIAVIACPIAKMAPKLRLLLKGDPSAFSKNPFFMAGLSGKGVTKDGNNRLTIVDKKSYRREGVPDVLQKIEATEFENEQDADMYVLGLQSYASILGGFEKIDTSEILADDPEEAETEPITPAASAALQESKEMLRWKQLAGIL